MVSHDKAEPNPVFLLCCATLFALGLFAIQARQGVNLADEGFLWYGVKQTVHGEIPLRDFQSYDPGRYYWSAGWALLFGEGLVALRFSETAFQIIGLWVALLTATRITRNWITLTVIAVMFLLWMFPSHKLFDHTLLLCGIWTAVRVVEQQSTGRVLSAGMFVGLCFFFGRNHALYNFLAQVFLLIFLQSKSGSLVSFSEFGIWISGILLGLIPLLILFVCAGGFASSYIESVRSILHQGTNLFLPIPWPWQIWPLTDVAAATRWLLGIFLVALPISYLAAIAASLSMRAKTRREHALFIACPFVGLLYLHHAFSRADFSHLAQVIHPFLLLVLALPFAFAKSKPYRWISIAGLCAISLLTIDRQTPLFQRLGSRTAWERLQTGDTIFVPPNVNRPIVCLQKFAAQNIPPDAGVLIAPFYARAISDPWLQIAAMGARLLLSRIERTTDENDSRARGKECDLGGHLGHAAGPTRRAPLFRDTRVALAILDKEFRACRNFVSAAVDHRAAAEISLISLRSNHRPSISLP